MPGFQALVTESGAVKSQIPIFILRNESTYPSKDQIGSFCHSFEGVVR